MGTWICLAVQNFTSIAIGVGMRSPKYEKFPLFGKESPHRGTLLTDFEIFLGALTLYTPNYPTLVFQISCDSHHRLRSYC